MRRPKAKGVQPVPVIAVGDASHGLFGLPVDDERGRLVRQHHEQEVLAPNEGGILRRGWAPGRGARHGALDRRGLVAQERDGPAGGLELGQDAGDQTGQSGGGDLRGLD